MLVGSTQGLVPESTTCVVVYEVRGVGEAKKLHRRKYELWQYGETRPKYTTTSLSMARTINDIMLTTSNPKHAHGSHSIELQTCVHIHFTFLEQTELLSPARPRGKELGAHSTTRPHEFTWHNNCSQQSMVAYFVADDWYESVIIL